VKTFYDATVPEGTEAISSPPRTIEDWQAQEAGDLWELWSRVQDFHGCDIWMPENDLDWLIEHWDPPFPLGASFFPASGAAESPENDPELDPEGTEPTATSTASSQVWLRPPYEWWIKTRGGKVFVPPIMGREIVDALSLTRGPGGGLWWDAGGVYRPSAEDLVADIIRRHLADDFRRNHLNEVIAWCKTLPVEITTDPPSERLLNVANGVLDLDVLELRPVRATERFTYQLPVPWVPIATCPEIEAFVREVVPPDCVSLVTEILGLCLLQTSRFRRAVMLLGSGSNGKSVLLRLMRELLGPDNISSVTLHALSEERFAKAQLFGRLANISGDLDSRPIERSDAFKMLTGEDMITADHKYGQPFQFVNFATMIFSANEWPVSHDQTDAYFTRWIAIPFTQRYREDGGDLKPGERRADPKLAERLTTPEELQGLLVRAVHGARRLRERGGFAIPESVRNAVADYREWADTVLAWSGESVTGMPDGVFTRKWIYSRYRDWCRENERSALSSKKFWPRFREVLKDRGIEFEEGKDAQDERSVFGVRIV
jgi:putative DNA primase/helicase